MTYRESSSAASSVEPAQSRPRRRWQKRPRGRPVAAGAVALWLFAAAPADVAAITCPSPGAQVKVCVKNPTAQQVSGIQVSGATMIPGATCTGSPPYYWSYSQTLTVGGGATVCVTPSALWSGVWVHHITVTATGQRQHQRGVVLQSTDPQQIARVDWTYFPNVVTVNQTGDSACTSTCTTNCTFRQAIKKANAFPNPGPSTPVLVQFASTITGQIDMTTPPTCALALNRGYVTIDGTGGPNDQHPEWNGNPWIVGDPNAAAAGTQGPFPRVIDLRGNTYFWITTPGNAIKGLHIKNTLASGVAQDKNLIFIDTGGSNTIVRAVKVEGGNTLDCSTSPPPAGCSDRRDVINVGAAGAAITNVEGHSGLDKGLKAGQNGNATVETSWFHHNYRGGVQGTQGGDVTISNSVVELAGRSITNNLVMDAGANGLVANGSGSELTASKNIVWLSRNNGIAVRAGAQKGDVKDSYVCGNHFSGLGVDVPNPGTTTFGASGNASVYNANRGFAATGTSFIAQLIGPNNAFAHNDNAPSNPCDFENSTTTGLNAENNQWGTNPPRVCGAGPTDWSPVQVPSSLTLDIAGDSPTYPSNVILRGQTIRVNGTAFDAIRSNPPVQNCTRGDEPSTSCCLSKPPAVNVCGSGTHNPDPTKGTCVELYQPGAAAWSKLLVTAVTPTTIVTEVPEDVFSCVGGDSRVWVSDKTGSNPPRQDNGPYCTNKSPAAL